MGRNGDLQNFGSPSPPPPESEGARSRRIVNETYEDTAPSGQRQDSIRLSTRHSLVSRSFISIPGIERSLIPSTRDLREMEGEGDSLGISCRVLSLKRARRGEQASETGIAHSWSPSSLVFWCLEVFWRLVSVRREPFRSCCFAKRDSERFFLAGCSGYSAAVKCQRVKVPESLSRARFVRRRPLIAALIPRNAIFFFRNARTPLELTRFANDADKPPALIARADFQRCKDPQRLHRSAAGSGTCIDYALLALQGPRPARPRIRFNLASRGPIRSDTKPALRNEIPKPAGARFPPDFADPAAMKVERDAHKQI